MNPEISTCMSPVTFRAPTDATAQYQKRQLVSWHDQLFLVQRKSGSPSIFEIWEANFETQQFNRVFNLEGFIIFLSRGYSTAVPSSSLQDQDCVYFTENYYNTLYAFHIGDQSLSISKQFRVFGTKNSVPLLARLKNKVKNRSSDDTNNTDRSHNTLEPVVDSSNICKHLSFDLQRKISGYILYQDAQLYMTFRVVCKLWRSIAPPLRWKVDGTRFSSGFTQDSMWLLSLNQNDGLCTFYNPFRNCTCYMSNSDLVGCEIRYSKDGWLLVSRGKSLFLLEPFSKQIIHLPDRTEDYNSDTMSFSASPTNSSAWVIFGIACLDEYQVRISYLRGGDDCWTRMIMDNEGIPFALSCSSPVYSGEKFWVIGRDGDVGAFGVLEDGYSYWVIHKISQLYRPSIDGATRHFLVEWDRNVLYSVIVTRQHNVHVYELHFGQHHWDRWVKEVKNCLLFISEASSVAVRGGMKVSLDDAVLFPSFSCANDFIYYSLESATYKVLKDDCTDIHHQKELLGCFWIHSKLTPSFDQAKLS